MDTSKADATVERNYFLQTLFPNKEAYVNFRALRNDDKSMKPQWIIAKVTDTEAREKFLAANHNYNLYFGVAERIDPAGDGKIPNCGLVHALWADWDFKNITQEEIIKKAKDFHPPTILLRSGGGIHAYWVLENPINIRDDNGKKLTSYLKRLSVRLSSDPDVTDPARLMRLPATRNMKPEYGKPIPVKLATLEVSRSYTLDKLMEQCPEGPSKKGRPLPATPLPKIIKEGGRNRTLFIEGCRKRRLGLDEDEIHLYLQNLNETRCVPPLHTDDIIKMSKRCAAYPKAEDTFANTEVGDAEYFEESTGNILRHDHSQKHGQRWHIFKGHHWLKDNVQEIFHLGKEAILARKMLAIQRANSDDEKWAKAGERYSRIDHLIKITGFSRNIAVSGEEWDKDPFLLGVQNGVIDLRTGKLRDGNPEDLITKVSPVSYNPEAKAERWEQFLKEIFASEKDLPAYMQRVIGYCLTGDISEQVFWIFWGQGANGKSTLIETLMRYVFSLEYSWTIPFPTINWSESQTMYQKAAMRGKRFLTSAEIDEAKPLNEGLIKALTGGDTIPSRQIYEAADNFHATAKIVLRVNNKPELRGGASLAMQRRIKLVPFTERFLTKEDMERKGQMALKVVGMPDARSADKNLSDTLAGEAEGILAWAVEGCLDWQKKGLRHPTIVNEATDEYCKESDALGLFLEHACDTDDKNAEIRGAPLYNAYQSWCKSNDEYWMRPRDFGEEAKKRLRYSKRGNKVTYLGVTVLETEGDKEARAYDKRMEEETRIRNAEGRGCGAGGQENY